MRNIELKIRGMHCASCVGRVESALRAGYRGELAGSEGAIETGQIVLVSGDLKGVARAIRLSRATMRKIRQNLFWAFFYNVATIPLAALGILPPIIAAAAMAASSVSVVSNSLILRWKSLEM